MDEHVEEIYRDIILEHNRNPRNVGPLRDFTYEASCVNPYCGDKITVQLKIEDDSVTAIHFKGEGCVLCKASASLMTTKVKGLSVTAANTEVDELESVMLSENEPQSIMLNKMGDIAAVTGARKFPLRIKCVLLAWEALKKALN